VLEDHLAVTGEGIVVLAVGVVAVGAQRPPAAVRVRAAVAAVFVQLKPAAET